MRKRFLFLGAMFAVAACSSRSDVVEPAIADAGVARASDDSSVAPDTDVDASTNVPEAGEGDSGSLPSDSGVSDAGTAIVDSGLVPLSCASYLAGRPIPSGRTSVSCANLTGTVQETLHYNWTSDIQFFPQYPDPCGKDGVVLGSSFTYACCSGGPFDSGKLAVSLAVYALVETFAEDGGVRSKLTLFHRTALGRTSTYEFPLEGDLAADGTAREVVLDESSLSLLQQMASDLFSQESPPLPDSPYDWTRRTGRGSSNVRSLMEKLSVQVSVHAGSIDVRAALVTYATSSHYHCASGSTGTFAYEGTGSLNSVP